MQIRTERLLLRDFVESDWPAVLAYQSDPLYLRYNPWTERTEQDIRNFVETLISWQNEDPRFKFQLAIILLDENRLIGSCSLQKRRFESQEAELGYEIASECWGQGFATEAARALLGFGFEELKLHRIWASCFSENEASARVMEKLGMRREGHLQENDWLKERWWDTLLYALLQREWKP